jgi:hypothetical protein
MSSIKPLEGINPNNFSILERNSSVVILPLFLFAMTLTKRVNTNAKRNKGKITTDELRSKIEKLFGLIPSKGLIELINAL